MSEQLNETGVSDGGSAAENGNGAAVDEQLAGRVAADEDVVVQSVAIGKHEAYPRNEFAANSRIGEPLS